MAKEKLSKTKLIRLKDGTRDGGRDRYMDGRERGEEKRKAG